MKSIKLRLVRNFLFIIIISVTIMEMFFINTVKQNYYNNLEDNLFSQIKVSSDLYLRYFSDNSLHDNVLNNVDTFWKQTTAQVEIIDINGQVLMDSIGIKQTTPIDTSDIKNALLGKKGSWIGKVSYTSGEVMAVAYPLRSEDKIVGALRFITSLNEVNNEIKNIALLSIGFALLIILFFSLISFIMAHSIIGPLKEVTNVAEKMANGNYSIKSKKKFNDEIGKLSDTLNQMAKEILKKDELKNDFISSVSHELRTPLTSIKGWAITLKEGYEDKEILQDGLDIIEKESDRLTKMVEELLDFSKFVSGKIMLENKQTNITDMMDNIKKQMEPRANRENISLVVDYELDNPIIYIDENRLKQVFINIIDNAFKFSNSNGAIHFTASMDNKNICFMVIDNGCGISEEELPKIKEKFYKGKSSNSKNGIGLSICDEIIKLMKGKFEIKSKLNEFTEVTITIPLQEGM
jgi:signal transduction histidine kinase